VVLQGRFGPKRDEMKEGGEKPCELCSHLLSSFV
jgi:hypothetical protein